MAQTHGAGTSAHREHARRAAADARSRRRRWPAVTLAAAGAALLVGGLVLGVAGGIDRWLVPATGLTLPAGLVGEVATAAALAAAVAVVARARRPSPDTEAWAVGASGEAATAAALEPLASEGWVLFHDRRLPGRRANVDHVAVGPGGVWVIETKRWSGRLELGAGPLRRYGRAADGVYDQVWRQAEEVTRALPRFGVRARPVVCIIGGEVVHGRDQAGRLVRGPVEFHTAESLLRRLGNALAVLSPSQVRAAAAALDQALPPA